MAVVTARQPFVVVAHHADESDPAVGVRHLLAWLADQGNVDLHSVLWSRGFVDPARYRHGRFADVGAAHGRLDARVLRGAGLTRLGGGVAGRAARRALRHLPADAPVYLSSARSGAVLRYLPPGERRVLTHVHAIDRHQEPPLEEAKVAQLRAETDRWLADDHDTAAWLASTWDVPADEIAVVPNPVDASLLNRAIRAREPGRFRLGVAGAPWFRRDHTARMVQAIGRRRPDLELQLVWLRPVDDLEHLAPLRHDLRQLGVSDALEMGPDPFESHVLDDIDALVLTTPDDDEPWIAADAAGRGVPVVCFDTHRAAEVVAAGVGVTVDYPDPVGLAEAVLSIHDEEPSQALRSVTRRRALLRHRDVAVVGAQVLAMAGQAEPT